MRLKRLHFAAVAVTVAALAASLTAVPANASGIVTASTAPALVERAELAVGLQDDTVPGATEVLEPGTTAEIAATDETPALSVEVGADQESKAVYTADALTATSTRFAAVFASSGAGTASWDLGSGTELYTIPDGRVSVGDAEGNLLAGVDAPWAVDATGKAVATHYTVDGTTLTQHLDYTADTVFPVVADPKITSFPGYWTISLNRAESLKAVGTLASCAALFSKSPVPGLKVATVACAVLAAYGTPQLAGGKCLRLHIVGVVPVLGTWWPTWPKC